MSEKACRERKTVYDEITSETARPPLSLEELRQRLKHIAGLCWGLSIDINNEIELRHALEAERDQLNAKVKKLDEENKLLRMRLGSRERNKRRAIEKANAPAAEKPVSERTRKLNEKLAAMTPEERAKFERRLKAKKESQARYLAKKRAAQIQGGNDGSN